MPTTKVWKVDFQSKGDNKWRTSIPDWGDELTANRFALGVRNSGRKVRVYSKLKRF